jgi:glycosyltransferase involved in cell wall biosynthesis/GT2 family glycosyltransferase
MTEPGPPRPDPSRDGLDGDVLVVVVAYHAPDLLDRCLAELAGGFAVIVVDNSSDGQVAAVAAARGAEYIDPGRNLGFAGGVRLGCDRRQGRDVLLLNPDASIPPSGIRALHRKLRADPCLAAVAPAQHDPDHHTSARVGWPFPTPCGAWLEAVGLGRLRQRTDFLIGSVLLLADTALADVGGFDDRYFLYAEETDWQRRAADRGWRVALCPEVVATHVGAGTGGDPVARETHFLASHERYLRSHHGRLGWCSYRAAGMVGSGTRAALLPGTRGRNAAVRFRLLAQGPLRAEAKLDRTGLRIVHVVTTDAFAGVERYICQVANGLRARGHDVDVVGGAPERMRAELDPAVNHRPAGSLLAGTRALASLRHDDLVHVHMTAAEACAFLARPVNRAPVVATRHFAAERGSTALNRVLARFTSRPIAAEIAISEFVAASVQGKTTLIPNGVPDRPPASLEGHRVVMLQRLDEEKAPDVGIRAWAASGLGDRGWELVVAGSGVLRPGLERLASELGCASTVNFAGQVADTDGLLASSSMILAPAPAEPFGLSVVEAMSHGLPVVAAAGGAHVETVGDAGALFPPGDVTAAAALLSRLADDRAERQAMGAALRGRQRERYGLELHLDRLEAFYREVIAGVRS